MGQILPLGHSLPTPPCLRVMSILYGLKTLGPIETQLFRCSDTDAHNRGHYHIKMH